MISDFNKNFVSLNWKNRKTENTSFTEKKNETIWGMGIIHLLVF